LPYGEITSVFEFKGQVIEAVFIVANFTNTLVRLYNTPWLN